MILIFITNNESTASQAIKSGVDRIFVDLEVHGKEERQGHLDTHRACHTPHDIVALRRSVPADRLMARVNPLHGDSKQEIDAVIAAGAGRVMLPMFTTADEVREFLAIVNGRAGATLLLETPQALARIDEVLLHSESFDEVHIGLNDLHLGMGLDFMFELLSGGIVEYAAEKIRKRGVRLGIGGIARIGEGAVSAEMVIGEHIRIGSEMVILSRSFHRLNSERNSSEIPSDLTHEIEKIRSCFAEFCSATPKELDVNKERFQKAVRSVVASQQRNSGAGVKS